MTKAQKKIESRLIKRNGQIETRDKKAAATAKNMDLKVERVKLNGEQDDEIPHHYLIRE